MSRDDWVRSDPFKSGMKIMIKCRGRDEEGVLKTVISNVGTVEKTRSYTLRCETHDPVSAIQCIPMSLTGY